MLRDGGKLTVVGPYRNNTIELFGLVESCGVEIPHKVKYSFEKFMDRFLTEMTVYSSRVVLDFIKNAQRWDSAEKLLKYWENTPYYDAKLHGKVQEAFEAYFSKNEIFQLTKRIAKFEFTKKEKECQ
jgi:hypothetical protein